MTLSMPSTAVFIDCDNCGLFKKFVRVLQIPNSLLLVSVYWRFLAFPKKLSPQQIPASIDSEDPIIEVCEFMLELAKKERETAFWMRPQL